MEDLTSLVSRGLCGRKRMGTRGERMEDGREERRDSEGEISDMVVGGIDDPV